MVQNRSSTIDLVSQERCHETEFLRLTRSFPSSCLVRLLPSAEAQTWVSRVAKKGSLIRGQRNVDVGVAGVSIRPCPLGFVLVDPFHTSRRQTDKGSIRAQFQGSIMNLTIYRL